MAWFGDSLANLKGQITSFTKDVLAETPEDEDGAGGGGGVSAELEATKKAFADLQEFCSKQKREIEQLRAAASGGLPEGPRDVEEEISPLKDALKAKEEENAALRQKLDEVQESFEATISDRIAEIRQEYDAKAWIAVEPEQDASQKSQTSATSAISKRNVSVQTLDEPSVESFEVGTLTDFVEDNQTAEEESYRKELEERIAAYEQDLYILRGELMTIQQDVDQEEEIRAKFNEDVISILFHDFSVDGRHALTKPKIPSPDSIRAGEELITTAIRQLASLWRGVQDQKGALERTVAKLSTATSQIPQQQGPPSEPELESEPDVFLGESSGDGEPPDFFPPRLDSFGLETILEEERNEEDVSKYGSDDVDAARRSKTSSVEMYTRPEVELVHSSTQSDEYKEVDVEALRTEILATLEEAYLAKERGWVETLDKRESKIARIEAELARLKDHLVDTEEQHTVEMMASETREKELQNEIGQLSQQIMQIRHQSERSADVKEEIARLEADRDFAKAQCSSFEDQIQKLGSQLQNLNFVLEQFQKEKDVEVTRVRRQLEGEVQALNAANKALADELRMEKELMEKAKAGLDAARQLNLQIEEKSRAVAVLREQVQERDAEVSKLQAQLDEVSNNNVAKIDRYLVKNLVVGYFSTPPDKRQEVLRVIATVLDFNREDRQKTGLESTSLWPFRSEQSSAGGSNQSLSQAFIKFLETESQPKAQIKIPMEEIARKHSRTPSESSGSSSTHNLASSPHPTEMSMTLPVLNQADRSNSILKDVLNPKS